MKLIGICYCIKTACWKTKGMNNLICIYITTIGYANYASKLYLPFTYIIHLFFAVAIIDSKEQNQTIKINNFVPKFSETIIHNTCTEWSLNL